MEKNNKKIRWVNFLHMYQPPNINEDTVNAVVKNSYSFINKILKENKKAKLTVNVNSSLLEHLDSMGHNDLIKDINDLALGGRVELVLSAAYHPVLPLIPVDEAKRQIKLSFDISKKFFPKIKIKGFFFPEMVYDKRIVNFLKNKGIKWILLDELSYNGKFNNIDYSKKYIDKNSGLQIVFRNREYSKNYPPKTMVDLIDDNFSGVVVSGTDAELYGDRHIDYTGDFYDVVNNKKVECQTVGEFLGELKDRVVVNPRIVSWDTEEKELKKKQSLYLWNNPKNKIHNKLWELTYMSLDLVKKAKGSSDSYKWARAHLDRGLSSCVYWWASEKNFNNWVNPAWHPDQIIGGADDLIRSIRSINSISIDEKLKAEKIYRKIEELVWKRHWKRYYKRHK